MFYMFIRLLYVCFYIFIGLLLLFSIAFKPLTDISIFCLLIILISPSVTLLWSSTILFLLGIFLKLFLVEALCCGVIDLSPIELLCFIVD